MYVFLFYDANGDLITEYVSHADRDGAHRLWDGFVAFLDNGMTIDVAPGAVALAFVEDGRILKNHRVEVAVVPDPEPEPAPKKARKK